MKRFSITAVLLAVVFLTATAPAMALNSGHGGHGIRGLTLGLVGTALLLLNSFLHNRS